MLCPKIHGRKPKNKIRNCALVSATKTATDVYGTYSTQTFASDVDGKIPWHAFASLARSRALSLSLSLSLLSLSLPLSPSVTHTHTPHTHTLSTHTHTRSPHTHARADTHSAAAAPKKSCMDTMYMSCLSPRFFHLRWRELVLGYSSVHPVLSRTSCSCCAAANLRRTAKAEPCVSRPVALWPSLRRLNPVCPALLWGLILLLATGPYSTMKGDDCLFGTGEAMTSKIYFACGDTEAAEVIHESYYDVSFFFFLVQVLVRLRFFFLLSLRFLFCFVSLPCTRSHATCRLPLTDAPRPCRAIAKT